MGHSAELEKGNAGEFTVWVDGKVVSEKRGQAFPEPHEIVAAVEKALGI
jgi:hypothetical protein